MKKLVFGVLAAVLFISACKKDDTKTAAPGSYFSFNDTTVLASHGYVTYGENSTSGASFIFIDTPLVATFTGKASAINFLVDTVILGQTYTYKADTSATFDKTKNFYDAVAEYKADWVNGAFTGNTTGRSFEDVTAGSFTINKSGDIYTFTYSAEFPAGKITGNFNGVLTVVKGN
jgi:hypothetical protein